MTNGHCLCGAVAFTLHGALPKLYQCHCSDCRRATGAAANAATLIAAEQFRWTRGEALIRSYSRPDGYRSDFCGQCGSPLPNPIPALGVVWIPAGLLDSGEQLEIAAHLYMDSQAPWEDSANHAQAFATRPELQTLMALLNPPQSRQQSRRRPVRLSAWRR